MRQVVFLSLLFLAACTDTTPWQDEVGIRLSIQDVSCTEAWLHIQTSSSRGTILLVRDGNAIVAFSPRASDTVVIDEGLSPGRSYTYQARRVEGWIGSEVEWSEPVSVRTQDTTTHEFSFERVLLGDGNSSALYDVAMISDTLAYAVGELYFRDSLGNWDPNAYNLIKWDGTEWIPLRIQFYTICGQPSRTPYPASSVYAFSPNDVWIAMNGSQVARWDGNVQTATMCLPASFSIRKLWGENPNSVYAVGDRGNIVRYTNGTWQRLSSGTTVDLTDVCGNADGSAAWACGFWYTRAGTILLRGQGSIWQVAYDGTPTEFAVKEDTLSGAYTSILAMSSGGVLVCSHLGVFRCMSNASGRASRLSFAPAAFPGFPFRIRGVANDFLVVGDYGMVAHYNGITWRNYWEPNAQWCYYSLANSNDMVVVVGREQASVTGRAVALIGRR